MQRVELAPQSVIAERSIVAGDIVFRIELERAVIFRQRPLFIARDRKKNSY